MAIRLRSGEGSQLLPEGTHDAALEKLEEATGAKGPYLRWHFVVTHEGSSKPVSGVSPMTLDRGSKTRYWAEGLLAREIADGEELDLERLVGRACRIVVYTATLEDGRKFTRIEKVLRKGGLTLSAKKEPVNPPAGEEELGEHPF